MEEYIYIHFNIRNNSHYIKYSFGINEVTIKFKYILCDGFIKFLNNEFEKIKNDIKRISTVDGTKRIASCRRNKYFIYKNNDAVNNEMIQNIICKIGDFNTTIVKYLEF